MLMQSTEERNGINFHRVEVEVDGIKFAHWIRDSMESAKRGLRFQLELRGIEVRF